MDVSYFDFFWSQAVWMDLCYTCDYPYSNSISLMKAMCWFKKIIWKLTNLLYEESKTLGLENKHDPGIKQKRRK